MDDVQAPSHLIKIGETYYAQVRVPSDIASTYGRVHEKRSLRTKDHREACRQLHGEVAAIKRKFDDHRTAMALKVQEPKAAPGPQSFTDLGRQYGREIAERELTARIDLYEAAVRDPKAFWRGMTVSLPTEPDEFRYFDHLAAEGDLDRAVGYLVREGTKARIADLKRMIETGDLGEMLALAKTRSPGLDRIGDIALALTFARSEIAVLQGSPAGDDQSGTEVRPKAPTPIPASASNIFSTTPALSPVSLDVLFEKWRAETKPSASTLSTWRGHFRSLKEAFPAKVADAGLFTPEDIIDWKDALVAQGLAAKTINAGYLASVRTIFNYGVTNRLVPTNPGLSVKSAAGNKGKPMLPYTNEEVVRLLNLARKETHPARRWLPWLAAQTGSRIGEVAQLQGNYVMEEGGIHYLDIKAAPDAGSVKEEVSERTVPIHPQLIADGFLDFVASKGTGPLFYGRSSGDPTKKHASKGVTNSLSDWIRENGFNDPRKAPNHALRHWFKTEAARVGIDSRDVDKLQGHAPRSEADKYYHPDLAMKLAALKKIRLPSS